MKHQRATKVKHKHTPGPWKFDRETWTIRMPFTSATPQHSDLMGDYRGCIIADLNGSHGGRSRYHAHPEAEANAALLAVSPELLATLRHLVAYVEHYFRDDLQCDHSVNLCGCDLKMELSAAKEIIAKAERRNHEI